MNETKKLRPRGIRTTRKRSQAPLEYLRISVRFLPEINEAIQEAVKKGGHKTRDDFFRAAVKSYRDNLPVSRNEWASVIALYEETPTGGNKMINIRLTGESLTAFEDMFNAMEEVRYCPRGIKAQIIFASIAKHVIDFKSGL